MDKSKKNGGAVNSLKMAGVELRSIVKKDEPDLVFLDGNTAGLMLEDSGNVTWGVQRDYFYWLMPANPIDFIEKDLLTKRFFHPSLITEVDVGFSAPNRASFELEYQWGWMVIDFIDHTQDTLPGDDRTDEWLVTPATFTREQKLFAIEIKFQPLAMSTFMERRLDSGDHSFTDRLIDMDLIEIALKYRDAFFHGRYENMYQGFWRPGRHIKSFEAAADTWIFRHDLYSTAGRPLGDNAFFALRKRVTNLNVIYGLGKDWLDIPYGPPFSGLPDALYNEVGEGGAPDFPLFRGRNPMDLFQPTTAT